MIFICESNIPADTAHFADITEQLHFTEELGWKLKIPITGGLKETVLMTSNDSEIEANAFKVTCYSISR